MEKVIRVSSKYCLLLVALLVIASIVFSGCSQKEDEKGNAKLAGTSGQAIMQATDGGVSTSQGGVATSSATSTKPGVKSDTKENGKPVNSASGEETKNPKKTGPALTITGKGVNGDVKLTLSELKEMKDGYFSDDFFALNNYGTKAYFSFSGIKINALLDAAGVKPTATKVTFVAEDGYEQSLSLEDARRENYIDEQDDTKQYPVMIAWSENGEAYREADGLPFRMVIGQKAPGDINKPQWVSNVAKIVVE